MSDENGTHLLRKGGLPGIVFSHATRGSPLACLLSSHIFAQNWNLTPINDP
jgi:hypothetical protein